MDEWLADLFPFREVPAKSYKLPVLFAWIQDNIECIDNLGAQAAGKLWTSQQGIERSEWHVMFNYTNLTMELAMNQHERLAQNYGEFSPAEFRFAREQDAVLFRLRFA